MKKAEFLSELQSRLAGLPEEDVHKTTEYFCEMIDERIEDGFTEEDAVEAVGSVDDAVAGAVDEVSLPKLIKERVKPRRALRAWEIALIIAGFPLWVSLLVTVFALAFALYIVLWSLVISVYAVTLAFSVSSIACIVAAFPKFFLEAPVMGMASLSIGFICAGLAIAFINLSIFATKGLCVLTKKLVSKIKSALVGKEKAQ